MQPRAVHFWFDMDSCTVHVKFGGTDTVRRLQVPVVPSSSIVLSLHGKALARMSEFATVSTILPVSMTRGWNFIELGDDDDDNDDDDDDNSA